MTRRVQLHLVLAMISTLFATFAATLPVGASVPTAIRTPRLQGTTLVGTRCAVFPADNVWNTDVSKLPVSQHSAAWVAAIDEGNSGIDLHPDFGPGGGVNSPYGIPFTVVKPSRAFVRVNFTYASESDAGPYPFGPNTPIEGGAQSTGDRHALMVDPKTCVLYELYDARYGHNGTSTAGSGAIWHLNSNRLRPTGWTSADAAGLPILPGLVTYDEVMSGHINHAIRFTAPVTDDRYIWPARHQASNRNSPTLPPMGARFRLKSSFKLARSKCAASCQTVITAMKHYGLILADNGSSWYFQGSADTRWTYDFVDQLKQIPARAFVGVNESSLMCSPNSGQVRQAGIANGGCSS